MKRIAVILGVLLCILCCGCTEQRRIAPYVSAINQNADFDLLFLQDVKNADLSEFGYLPGFGCSGYYHKKYENCFSDADEITYPDNGAYVLYTVTSYPDYSDNTRFVTRIEITDPAVAFCGDNTVTDCERMFDYFRKQGFKVAQESWGLSATKGRLRIQWDTNTRLTIGYEVQNRNGIVF